jgi:hypothetical protein
MSAQTILECSGLPPFFFAEARFGGAPQHSPDETG